MARVPILVGHFTSVGVEPHDVLQPRPCHATALEIFGPSKNRMLLASCDQPPGKNLHLHLPRLVLPTEPRKFIILAVGLVSLTAIGRKSRASAPVPSSPMSQRGRAFFLEVTELASSNAAQNPLNILLAHAPDGVSTSRNDKGKLKKTVKSTQTERHWCQIWYVCFKTPTRSVSAECANRRKIRGRRQWRFQRTTQN